MKILPFVIVALSVVAAVLLVQKPSHGGQAPKIRPMAVAGTFYPADPKELGGMIDGFLSKAAPPPLPDVVALVAPHAGYIYSAPVAAYSYALLKGRKFDRVVVVAPSHYEAFNFSSVYDGAAYLTPFGQVPVDRAFAAKLAKASPSIKLSSVGHTPSADHPEHALEVQLPFLQRVIGPFQLVPVIMGNQSYDACRDLGVALAKLLQGTNTLIVASSDLSHYHTYNEAVSLDHKTLNAIAEYDYFDLARNLSSRLWEACGGGPIVAVMIAAERLGATEAKVLRYANTGDVTGDRSRVVGYGAVALVKAAGAKTDDAPFSLTSAEKTALLKIARQSVETAVREHKSYEAATGGLEALARERGAFVTITKNGQLRGCIGYVAPVKPLYITVRDVAMMAALKDTRFRPVAASELASLQYEISVLSPLRRVMDIQEIRIGQHGLLIHTSDHEGLLLPQVPVEEKWNRATFLEEVCFKAGLPPRAWQDPAADLFRFTALVFNERKQMESLTPLELFRDPLAMLSPPGPGSPSPAAAPF
jgi:AmmeMemoRadiSam system protein B/AmmeMemoRadiSam system protein A